MGCSPNQVYSSSRRQVLVELALLVNTVKDRAGLQSFKGIFELRHGDLLDMN